MLGLLSSWNVGVQQLWLQVEVLSFSRVVSWLLAVAISAYLLLARLQLG